MSITHLLLSIVSVISLILYWKFRQNIIFPLLLVIIFISVKQIEYKNISYMNEKVKTATPIIKTYLNNCSNIEKKDIEYLINDRDIHLNKLEVINNSSGMAIVLDMQCDKHLVEVTDNFIVQQ